MKTHRKSLAMLLALVMVATLVLSGCGAPATTTPPPAAGNTPGPAAATPQPANTRPVTVVPDTLTIGIASEPGGLDVHQYADGAGVGVVVNFCEGLMFRNNDTYEYEPWLANSWETLDEYTTRFHLRDDVYFHDGGHMTADDVLFTFERGNELPARRFAYTPFDIPNCKVVDDYTIDIVSKTPFAPALAYLSSTGVFIHSRESVANTTLQEYNRNPVGVTGAYRFSEWIAGDRIILERNEDYWGVMPEFKYLVFRIMTDATARTLAIESNDIDILMAPLSSSIASLSQNPDVEVLVSFGLSTTNILFNNQHPVLSDQRVREALLWAIDIPGMSNIAFSGTGEPGSAFVAPIIPGWHAPDPDGPWVNQNLDKARALLADAGYADGFDIEIWCNENQARIDIAEMLQNAWGAIGVRCEVSVLEFATQIAQMDEGLHDVSLNGFVPPGLDMDFAYSQLHTGPWSQNYMGYSNPEVDRLFELGRSSLNQDERIASYSKIIDIYREEIPSISMHHQTQFYVIRSTLTGLENHPQNLPHFYLVHSK